MSRKSKIDPIVKVKIVEQWYIRNKIIRYIVYIMKNPAR